MQQFRNMSFPIDSFIMDYDWFGQTQGFGCRCGTDGVNGELLGGDFGYEGKLWANQTFGRTSPARLLAVFELSRPKLRNRNLDTC